MSTPDEIAAKVDAARKRAEAATFGPWGWFGYPKHPYLATHTGGRVYVMGFERSGMSGATMMLQSQKEGRVGFRMEKAENFAVTEVSYRDDLDGYREGIDHPDAIFIAHAREDVPFLCDAYDAEKKRADEQFERAEDVLADLLDFKARMKTILDLHARRGSGCPVCAMNFPCPTRVVAEAVLTEGAR